MNYGAMAMLLAGMLAVSLSAKPYVSMMDVGRFSHDRDDVCISAQWDIEYPIAVEGLDEATVEVLRQKITGDCYGNEEITEQGELITPASLLKELSHTFTLSKSQPPGTSLSLGAFDFTAKVRLVFVARKWLGYDYNGYYNRGGCGCHARRILRVLSIPELKPLQETDFLLPDRIAEFHAVLVECIREAGKIQEVAFDVETSVPSFMPRKNGMEFCYPAYTLFAGWRGIRSHTISWEMLKPYCRPERWAELKALTEEIKE